MNRDRAVDYSFWQGDIDPAVAVENEANILLFRGGSANLFTGEPYKDYQFDNNVIKIPAVADSGIYWYTRLNKNWLGQMEFLLDLIKDKPLTIRPTLDIEEYKDQYGNTIKMSTLQARLKQCVDMIYAELKLYPIIYTRTSIWDPFFGNPSWAVNCPLFVARYVFKEEAPDNVLEICDNLQPYTTTVPLPKPWKLNNNDWILWQCTADDNKLGAKYGVPLPPNGTLAADLSLTNGKKSDFMNRAGMVQPPPIPPGDDMQYCKVTLPAGQTKRNMRSLPDSVYPGQGIDVGDVYPLDTSGDKVLPVLKIHINAEGTWYLILKESENMKIGWVLAIAGNYNYLTLV